MGASVTQTTAPVFHWITHSLCRFRNQMKPKPEKLKQFVVAKVDIYHLALAWWRVSRKYEKQMQLELKGKA